MFGIILLSLIISGFIFGKLTHKFIKDEKTELLNKLISILQNISIFLLLSMMGYKIGSNEALIANFSIMGLHSALFGIATLIASTLFTWLFVSIANKISQKNKINSHIPFSVDNKQSSQFHNFIMIIIYLGLVVLGGFLGYFKVFTIQDNILNNTVDGSLIALIFIIGIDMGLSQLTMDHLLSIGKSVMLICFGVIIGSLTGGLVLGIILGYDFFYSLAISSPMGWYSLAGIMLSKIDAELGAMAFSANLIRELLAMAFIPIIGALMSEESAIAACGSTAMDTTLPAITKGLGKQYAVTGFACGIIISSVVPFFLSIIQIIYGII